MTLGGHLVELRRRLMIAAAAVVVGMVVAFFCTDPVIELITAPIRVVAGERDGLVALNFDTVTSGFDLRMRIAFAIGLLVSAPVWLWQIWAFLMPGLTRREIRHTVGFVSAAVPLFFAGCATGVVVMPHIVELMAQFLPAQAAALYNAASYYDFTFKLMIVVGISYVLPVFLVALNIAGIVSGRSILHGWRVAVLVAAVFAALATPAADVVSMLMLAGVLVTLYLAASGVTLVLDRRRAKALAAVTGSAS
ncbi:twin-arginine translocase subunit TatC [Microbacterium sp. NPDC091313]